MRTNLPPFPLIHGDKDARVPLEQSLVFQKAMKDAGNTCDLVTVAGGGHGMGDWHKLKSDYQIQLVDWLRAKLK
ncbi:MAG TPA: prolyl oligopeptidase family serine peptidase [Luteolibacter sp.]|nr:prolyl oligopeptidase family serine peptidase [Luteolibacter sp.]